MKARSLHLLFDNCIIDLCNRKCEYCRSEPTRKAGDKFVTATGTLSHEEALKKIKESIDRGYMYTDAPILKISGYGEVLLIDEVVALLSDYEKVVQIITNGILLRKVLHEIKESNIQVCVSLDGHSTALNRARVKTDTCQKVVTHNIEAASALHIPLEINSVLTKYNTNEFSSFLDWLHQKDITALVYPFPVRHNYLWGRGISLYPERKDIDRFVDTVVCNYEQYSDVLPPHAYMERLTTFLYKKERSNPCFVGLVNFCVNPQGTLLKCCCGWDDPLGTIWSHPESLSDFERISRKHVPPACVDCFTHYEIMNCFFEGETTLRELQKIALFQKEEVSARLDYLKKYIQEGDF